MIIFLFSIDEDGKTETFWALNGISDLLFIPSKIVVFENEIFPGTGCFWSD